MSNPETLKAINIIRRAFPEKSESWAQEQLDSCINNTDVDPTSEVIQEILKGQFGIIVLIPQSKKKHNAYQWCNDNCPDCESLHVAQMERKSKVQ